MMKKYIIAFIVVWIGVTIIFNRELNFFGFNWFWTLIPIGLLYGGANLYIEKQKEKEQEEKKAKEEQKRIEEAKLIESSEGWSFFTYVIVFGILGGIVYFVINLESFDISGVYELLKSLLVKIDEIILKIIRMLADIFNNLGL